MSELPSLFIANSKISLFLKKNLPHDHQKKITCMHANYENTLKAHYASEMLSFLFLKNFLFVYIFFSSLCIYFKKKYAGNWYNYSELYRK
jgi:hypothetical protein